MFWIVWQVLVHRHCRNRRNWLIAGQITYAWNGKNQKLMEVEISNLFVYQFVFLLGDDNILVLTVCVQLNWLFTESQYFVVSKNLFWLFLYSTHWRIQTWDGGSKWCKLKFVLTMLKETVRSFLDFFFTETIQNNEILYQNIVKREFFYCF